MKKQFPFVLTIVTLMSLSAYSQENGSNAVNSLQKFLSAMRGGGETTDMITSVGITDKNNLCEVTTLKNRISAIFYDDYRGAVDSTPVSEQYDGLKNGKVESSSIENGKGEISLKISYDVLVYDSSGKLIDQRIFKKMSLSFEDSFQGQVGTYFSESLGTCHLKRRVINKSGLMNLLFQSF
jgi:hypothetical protein